MSPGSSFQLAYPIVYLGLMSLAMNQRNTVLFLAVFFSASEIGNIHGLDVIDRILLLMSTLRAQLRLEQF